MIWNSIFFMAIIDIIMLCLIILSLWDLYHNRKLLQRLKVFSGLALVVGGLFGIGSLYFMDLYAMHLFPILLPTGKTMKFLEDLHLNYNWIITTSGIAILVLSVLYINRVIFPKIMKLENELTMIASTDSLTEVYNRSKYSEIIEREIERAKRFHLSLSIIMFDIDAFKGINDTYGHYKGIFKIGEPAQSVFLPLLWEEITFSVIFSLHLNTCCRRLTNYNPRRIWVSEVLFS